MANAATLSRYAATEKLLRELPADASIGMYGTQFSANCHVPPDVIRGTFCHALADSLEEAVAKLLQEVERAKAAKAVIRTAAECKAEVIRLIHEHDAAPAAFRDAVDELNVQS